MMTIPEGYTISQMPHPLPVVAIVSRTSLYGAVDTQPCEGATLMNFSIPPDAFAKMQPGDRQFRREWGMEFMSGDAFLKWILDLSDSEDCSVIVKNSSRYPGVVTAEIYDDYRE